MSTQRTGTAAVDPEDADRPADCVDYTTLLEYARHEPASWSHLFFLLALCYDAGLGVTHNPGHAYKLFCLAIGAGTHDAAEKHYDAGRPRPAAGGPTLATAPLPRNNPSAGRLHELIGGRHRALAFAVLVRGVNYASSAVPGNVPLGTWLIERAVDLKDPMALGVLAAVQQQQHTDTAPARAPTWDGSAWLPHTE